MSLFQFYEEENTREESLNNYKYLFRQFEKNYQLYLKLYIKCLLHQEQMIMKQKN